MHCNYATVQHCKQLSCSQNTNKTKTHLLVYIVKIALYNKPILAVAAIKLVDSSQGLLVIYSLVDSYEEGEGRGQLDSVAEFLVAPVKTAQPFSQVSAASTLQSILQHFSLIRLIPSSLIPVELRHLYTYVYVMTRS